MILPILILALGALVSILLIVNVLVPDIFFPSLVNAYNVPFALYITLGVVLVVLYHVFATNVVTLLVVHVPGFVPVPHDAVTTPLATVAPTLDLK